MKIAGIIAEYNPFHKGHEYQITYTREHLGADYVIIAMSGDYVQRGTPALLPKHTRAEMALKCGADLVLELPVSVSTASAELFAKGGVQLLENLGVVDFLCFGSESGSISELNTLASLLIEEPEEYKQVLKKALAEGKTFPSARALALQEYAKTVSCDSLKHAEEILLSPNNILGIEYCKALLQVKSCIEPCTLKREGAGYHDTSLSKTNPSASAIRKHFLFSESNLKDMESALPKAVFPTLLKAAEKNAFVTEEDFSLLLHYRLLEEENPALFLDVSPELSRRICNTRNKYQSFSQFVSLLKTKEMTQTRIQRALLHLLLQVKETPENIPFARVLGFRKESTPLLKEIKKRSSIPLVTKVSDAAVSLADPDKKLLSETVFASNVYESILCSKTGKAFRHEFEKQLVIL